MSAGGGHRPRMLVLDDREQIIRSAPGADRLRALCDVTFLDGPLADTEVVTDGVEVLMAVRERTPLPAATLSRFPSLRLLVQTGGHAYHLDGEEASRRGIPVALGRRAVVVRRAIPELTMMLALTTLRRLPEARTVLERHQWRQPTGRLLHGRRLGVLGLGRHGQGVVRLARAFGMDVTAWARTGSADSSDIDGAPVPLLPLDQLLAESDVVTVHLRLSPGSRGLLDGDRLRAMKPGAVLVNTSRGAIVDEHALAEVLANGPLAGAGLDVFAEEPLPGTSPLRDLDNVVMTPHLGWTVEEVFEEFASIAADQVADFLDGRLAREELQDPGVALAPGPWGGLSDGG